VRAKDAKDPDAARKELADAFATLSVLPADLKGYLGHELGQCSPAELTQLRGLFAGIRDGAITWAEVLAEKAAADGPPGDGKARARTVADKLAERAAKKAATAANPVALNTPATVVAVLLCAVCDKPVTEGLSTLKADGSPGIRHKECQPISR
jgi:hypothetical protein